MTLTKAQREQLKNKYGGRCAYCGCTLTAKWQADHLLPLKRTGKWVPKNGRYYGEYVQTGITHPERDTLGNMMPCCIPCNNNKSNVSLETWRKQLEHLPDVLMKNYSAWRHAQRFGLVQQVGTKVVFHFETYTVRRKFRL